VRSMGPRCWQEIEASVYQNRNFKAAKGSKRTAGVREQQAQFANAGETSEARYARVKKEEKLAGPGLRTTHQHLNTLTAVPFSQLSIVSLRRKTPRGRGRRRRRFLPCSTARSRREWRCGGWRGTAPCSPAPPWRPFPCQCPRPTAPASTPVEVELKRGRVCGPAGRPRPRRSWTNTGEARRSRQGCYS